MNRRNFFHRATAGLSLLFVGGKAKPSEPTPQYQWDFVNTDNRVTLTASTLSGQEIADAVQRELIRILEE